MAVLSQWAWVDYGRRADMNHDGPYTETRGAAHRQSLRGLTSGGTWARRGPAAPHRAGRGQLRPGRGGRDLRPVQPGGALSLGRHRRARALGDGERQGDPPGPADLAARGAPAE